jgi:hypothetical protein
MSFIDVLPRDNVEINNDGTVRKTSGKETALIYTVYHVFSKIGQVLGNDKFH